MFLNQHHRQGFVFEGREPCSISHYLSATIEDDCVTDSVFSFVFRLPCACDFAVSSEGVSFQLLQRACTECFWTPFALDASGAIYSMISVMHWPEPKMQPARAVLAVFANQGFVLCVVIVGCHEQHIANVRSGSIERV